MPAHHVLKIRRTDQANACVLVNAQQTGPSLLDLKLVATDGEAPFVAHLKQSRIQALRSSSYDGPRDEWASVLSLLFLQQHQQPTSSALDGVETVASVLADTLTINVRKNISGITQRLGAITLSLNDDEEIQLFDWAAAAAQSADDLRSTLATLQISVAAQQSTIQKLTAELDNLVKAKQSHEGELLKKFAALLNSKKLKIRDQQRLLAHAKVDPKAAAQIEQTRSAAGHKSSTSRRGKRKASGTPPESEADDDEIDVLTRSARERTNAEGDLDGAEQPSTPERGDLSTEDDDTDDDGFAPAPPFSQVSQLRRDAAMKSSQQGAAAPSTVGEPGTQALPPRRELPFARKQTETKTTSPAGALSTEPAFKSPASHGPRIADEDDETTDDEL